LYFDQCTSLKNVNGLANCNTLTRLNLKMCGALQNVDGLANLPNLTTLNLYACEALWNVDGLAGCTNLTSLDLRECKTVKPKPSNEVMPLREEVAAYQEEIKKSMKWPKLNWKGNKMTERLIKEKLSYVKSNSWWTKSRISFGSGYW